MLRAVGKAALQEGCNGSNLPKRVRSLGVVIIIRFEVHLPTDTFSGGV